MLVLRSGGSQSSGNASRLCLLAFLLPPSSPCWSALCSRDHADQLFAALGPAAQRCVANTTAGFQPPPRNHPHECARVAPCPQFAAAAHVHGASVPPPCARSFCTADMPRATGAGLRARRCMKARRHPRWPARRHARHAPPAVHAHLAWGTCARRPFCARTALGEPACSRRARRRATLPRSRCRAMRPHPPPRRASLDCSVSCSGSWTASSSALRGMSTHGLPKARQVAASRRTELRPCPNRGAAAEARGTSHVAHNATAVALCGWR